MRYGINGSGRMLTHGVAGVLDDISAAEHEGFTSYWVAQVGLIDALGLLGAHGGTGSDMELGTAVISTWERHPHALATQALTTATGPCSTAKAPKGWATCRPWATRSSWRRTG